MNLFRQRYWFRNSGRESKVLFVTVCRKFHLLRPFFATRTIHGSISSPSSKSAVGENPSSEMADYLVNSCGFLLDDVLSICTSMGRRGNRFRLSNAVETIDFLRGSGFTESQIRTVIRRRPEMLAADVEETLKPKIVAFLDLGLSAAEVARFVSSNPRVLHVSLQDYILPIIDVFKSFLPRDEDAIKCIKKFLFRPVSPKDVKERISTNLSSLRRLGVPESSLTRLLVTWPHVLSRTPSFLETMVEKTRDMRLDLNAAQYPQTLFLISSMKKSQWDSKLGVLKEFGWSEADIAAAIRRSPLFLYLSARKLTERMQFFMNDAGCGIAELTLYPSLLTFSLEKRVIPRFTVIRLLDSRKLLNRKHRVSTVLGKSDEKFYQEYVRRYKDVFPDIFLAYENNTINSGWWSRMTIDQHHQ